MNCTIKGIFQKMDFENNTLQNYLTVLLPTGEAIQCLIEDAVAERVIAAHTKVQERPPTPVVSVLMDSAAGFGTDAPVSLHTESDAPPLYDDVEDTENDEDGVPSV